MRSSAAAIEDSPYTHPVPLEERLIVPLDVPDKVEAAKLVKALGDAVQFYKIGLQFILGGGVDFVKDLQADGKKVFLDAKINDVEQTVNFAIQNVIKLGASFVTVHGDNGKAVREAVRSRGDADLKVFIVTALTSLDQADLHDLGIVKKTLPEYVLYRAGTAFDEGADGVIASGREAAAIKAMYPKLLVITPGIRSQGVPQDEQKRAVTPGEAIAAGADYLVVGRQITRSSDPRGTALAVLDEMREAAT